MRLKSIVTMVVVTLALSGSAKVVSPESAMQVASKVLRKSDAQTMSATSAMKQVWNSNRLHSDASVIRTLSNSDPTFYVFTPTQGKGFVIVAGDDAMKPILAYSYDGEFPDDDEVPCCLEWWMEEMDGYITQLRSEGTTYCDDVAQQWANPMVADADSPTSLNLTTALWAQGSPYNQQCPQVRGQYCQTGCVATSHAIAMRYHQWPKQGTGSTTAYTTRSSNIRVEARNLEHEYDWDTMPTSDMSKYGATSEQTEAVAGLMADLGALFQLNYGVTSTGGYSGISWSNAYMYQNMDYSSSMYWAYADGFDNEEDYYELIRNSIAECGPVLCRGSNSSGSGHIFVLDGYDDNNYFHINWGWGLGYNGDFMLPDINYTNEQRALIDLKPREAGEADEAIIRLYSTGMTMDGKPDIVSTKEFSLSMLRVQNIAVVAFTGYFVVALTDSEGNIKEEISDVMERTSKLNSEDHISYQNISCKITETINDGDRIRSFYRNTDVDEWRLLIPYDNASSCTWEWELEVVDYPDADLNLYAKWNDEYVEDGAVIYSIYDADRLDVSVGEGASLVSAFDKGTGVLTIVVTDEHNVSRTATYTITFIVPDLSLHATWDGEEIEDGAVIHSAYDADKLELTAGDGVSVESAFDEETGALTITIVALDDEKESETYVVTFVTPDLSLHATWDGNEIEDGEVIDGCYDESELTVTAGEDAIATFEYDDASLTLTITVASAYEDISETYTIRFTISTGIKGVTDTQTEGNAYDLSGRPAVGNRKGSVYIKDGKKIINK